MNKRDSAFRVFVDSNILVSAMLSKQSISRKLLFHLVEKHHLIICSYTIDEVSRVLNKRFPDKLRDWDLFLSSLDFELAYTPTDFLSFPRPPIRDEKDIAILVSALLAEPDIFISGDHDFHTPEIKEYLVVYSPSDFLRDFAQY